MESPELAAAIERHHQAADAFMRGDPGPLVALYSRRDDVTIANPFGPAAVGREAVATMERAARNYRDGGAVSFERVSGYATDELAYTVEVERLRAKVGGADTVAELALRVTAVFRKEDGEWRLVHRHADPITAPRPPDSVLPC